jgi:hypothetical protein
MSKLSTRSISTPQDGLEQHRARLLELVREHPGITTESIARAIELEDHRYLYRVMPELVRENLIRRVGDGWFPMPLAVTPALVDALIAEGLVQRDADGWRAIVPAVK